jgi:chloramphenicol-sensitive protein RarD
MVIEQTMLSVPMLVYIMFIEVNGTGSFSFNIGTSILLIGAGIISSLPQLIYIIASRMIKLSLIGILQYIYPLMVLVIGVFIYNEPISESRIIGFILIWIAVIIYIVDELKNKKRIQNG